MTWTLKAGMHFGVLKRLGVLQEEGVNWLQLHWEHMAFLPVNKLAALRDKVLEVLVLNCDALKATTDALALQRDNVRSSPFSFGPQQQL